VADIPEGRPLTDILALEEDATLERMNLAGDDPQGCRLAGAPMSVAMNQGRKKIPANKAPWPPIAWL